MEDTSIITSVKENTKIHTILFRVKLTLPSYIAFCHAVLNCTHMPIRGYFLQTPGRRSEGFASRTSFHRQALKGSSNAFLALRILKDMLIASHTSLSF